MQKKIFNTHTLSMLFPSHLQEPQNSQLTCLYLGDIEIIQVHYHCLVNLYVWDVWLIVLKLQCCQSQNISFCIQSQSAQCAPKFDFDYRRSGLMERYRTAKVFFKCKISNKRGFVDFKYGDNRCLHNHMCACGWVYCHKCNDSIFGHMLWALNAQIFALTMRTARFDKYFLILSELDMPYGAM